jgi:hypothetical protein
MNPNSLANLKRGHVPASQAERSARSQKAGRARAAKYMGTVERSILREYGPSGLALYRRGRIAGYNTAYLTFQRMRKVA